MGKYIIDESTLKNLANAIRRINGETKEYTINEMIYAITNIMDSVTYVLVDEYGNEHPAVFVESKTVFDATADDLREGKIAASDSGIIVGTGDLSTVEDNTFILVDEQGNELAAVLTEEKVDLTATANDIRSGQTAVTDDGVTIGTLNV